MLTYSSLSKFGDLSREIDKNVKKSVAVFCGKDEYIAGDLSREIAKRAALVAADLAKDGVLEISDVANELNRRRAKWLREYLGKDYEFGDITKKAISSFTGKEEYKFGDITKKIFKGIGF